MAIDGSIISCDSNVTSMAYTGMWFGDDGITESGKAFGEEWEKSAMRFMVSPSL